MIESFQNHIETRLSFLKKAKLLLAISGGLDSVVLAHLCYQLKLNIALVHCNFNLRGDESDADEDFVMQFAEKLDLEVFIESFDTEAYAKTYKLSTQMAARELRYNWFKELSEQLHFEYVLTAHHADDNLETFLINLSRGTGLDGLIGIPEVNDIIVRPLLPFSRQNIEDYAIHHHLKWREDSSNASTKYLRNKLRHEAIPVLKNLNPNFLQNFQTTLNNLNDTADMVEESLNAVLKRAVVSMDATEIKLKVSEFKKLNNPKAYLHEFLKDYGFTEWYNVVNLLEAQSGKQLFSSSHRLLKDRDVLILRDISSDKKQDSITIENNQWHTATPIGTLHLSVVDSVLNSHSNSIYVDKGSLTFPLLIRPWQEGDFFYPLGMQGKKKLSKYFKDEKLSLIDKENIWLLCSYEAIVWVISKRADNRFKVNENTKQILKIELK
ncbi:MAG: tRNA lysidine(34) synthetase TilS [Flavobacteriales bacterium]|nr:tRNA lysidine(34) synthetase TilS [Flavobacteriia bacterium]NCP05285.1 tRNA lysidine(34) synthetase TilS [Flavobacteriales bacterium]PIV95074.1 MAG: tRNA lysidine(34) synthetase TilS [Flavobacteriaceae bacterium CG17_big_fil_post_rev_8_21_14_2_50_33_15]PIY09298.1 MAG: tRNA lysidine(34) synthetase TilS [Flavobacteriaceae bacterium CG_4_10_14_3_um_filter_33_47]PJB20272.1 MAG: tRNA lysidine(34) synthetase TilS [Flavobacteriaceae bacterium CG_4_9_14_3_um_filter_33_16]